VGRPRTEDDYRAMAKLNALWRRGTSIRQSAGQLGLNPTTVARLVKERVERRLPQALLGGRSDQGAVPFSSKG
jgi:hypothetical protein